MLIFQRFNFLTAKAKTFSLVCSFISALSITAHAQTWSTLGDVNVTGSRDMAYDHLGKQLYVTTDAGAVQVFTLPARTANGSIQVGTNLKGIDISPDRTKLAVGNSDGGRVSIISLPSRAVTHYPISTGSGSGSTFSCAFIDNNTLVVGGRVLNLTTATITNLGYSFYGEGIVAPSATRNAIGFTEPGISSGTAGIYDPQTKTVSSVGSGWFTYDIAVSPTGNQIVVPTYSGSFVYDKVNGSYSKIGTIGVYASWWGRGAAYSPYQDHLFVSFSSSSSGANFPAIVAYNSKNLSRLTNVENASLFLSSTNASFAPGHLRMAANGRYLFALTATGVRIYDVSDGKRSIAVTRTPVTGGLVSGNGLVNTGSTVNMAATPNLGWLFTGWKGSRVESSATFAYTASDDAEFEATFAMDLSDVDGDTLTAFYELTVSKTDPTKRDSDGDLINDNVDLFPNNSLEWVDADSDGQGDNSDLDDDNDAVVDLQDAFPFDAAASLDTDGDGKPDEIVAGKETSLILDSDDDNDGYSDIDEVSAGSNPKNPSIRPSDNDGDFLSDFSDADDDNDLVADLSDAFPFDAAASVDTDLDGKPDSLVANVATSLIEDIDDDNDFYPDTIEIQVGSNPLLASSLPADYDGDLNPDLLDDDDDNDGVADAKDFFPKNRNEWGDNDGDLIGDNSDLDDDNDGYLDQEDPEPNTSAIVIGKYFGMIAVDDIITGGHGGTVELTVGKKGKASGVIRLASDTLRFRGSLGEQNGPTAPLIVDVPRKGRSPLRLEIIVGSDIHGNLSGGNYVTVIHGWKQRYGTRDRDTSSVLGSYNLAFTPSSIQAVRVSQDVPVGYGRASMKISPDGMVRMTGNLGDGSWFSALCPLGPEGQVGVWHQNSKQWSILGEFDLDNTGHLNGQIDWRRLPAVSPLGSLYPRGFQDVLQVSGSRVPANAALSFLTSFSGPGNTRIIFEGANIEATRQDPSMIFEISPDGKPKLPSAGSAANPTNLALQLDTRTGLYNGQCTLLDLSENGDLIRRKLSFEGIVTDQQATGFFLLESLPSDREPIKLIRSGSVKLLPSMTTGKN
jgi:Divergent InlB B-repeat domain/Bacterial TSP3 repeat